MSRQISTMSGRKYGLNLREYQICDMVARGMDYRDIAIRAFDCRSDEDPYVADEEKIKKRIRQIKNMMHKDGFLDCYNHMLQQLLMPSYARAFQVLNKQLDADNGWLQNKAANDIISRVGPAITGRDENTITVKIEGMPALGVPESQEVLEAEAEEERIYVRGTVDDNKIVGVDD